MYELPYASIINPIGRVDDQGDHLMPSWVSRRVGAAMVAALLTAGLAVLPVQAIQFSSSGTGVSGAAISASADFTINGNALTIILTNTALADNTTGGDPQDVPGNTLTGVFFDLTGNPSLTAGSATIAAGSMVQGVQCSIGPCDGTTTDVGGEFRYDAGAFPGGADRGVAGAGYIGGAANFPGALNLDGEAAVNGINFGIISADPSFLPNGGLASVPLIKNSVTFVLTGVSGLTENDISKVSFQYGTSITEPRLPPSKTPEPGTLLLLGGGLAAATLIRKHTRRN